MRRRIKKTAKIKIPHETSREIYGIFFAVAGVLSVLILMGNLGELGKIILNFLGATFGLGIFFLPPFLFGISIAFFAARNLEFNFTRLLGIFALFFGALGIVHTFLPPEKILENATAGGGWFGFAASFIFEYFLTRTGARVVLIGIFFIGAVLTFPVSLAHIFTFIVGKFWEIVRGKNFKKNQKNLKILAGEKKPAGKISPPKTDDSNLQKSASSKTDEFELPSLDLLSDEKVEIFTDEKKLQIAAEKIREKLLQFSIAVEMGAVRVGPTVTQFTLKPEEGVKISKIVGLKNDLALALSAHSLRIEAPIPGKNLVGIEIPNERRTVVHLREILESKNFSKIKSKLKLAFGRDVAGDAVNFDLATMPHLLIAGATGAGKSVAMNAFLLSLLFQNTPDELKLILIDPKRVELAPFENIPHLLAPVIVEADKALNALKWAVAEMMRRYKELSALGYRNVEEFNANEKEKIPKMVIVVDELADLMMRQFKKETEAAICRLAQMARAVGMHLIIATQRPSVDVITGLIKANIPSRASFAVTSQIDSRTILDAVGAEDLLGRGDLLFSNSALGRPLRIQGVLVEREEVQKVVAHLKIAAPPQFDDSILSGGESGGGGNFGDGNFDDDLVPDAIEFIRQNKKASASLLQRKLSIGYARAAKILDILEEKGMIGPARGAKPREIFL